MMRPYITWLFLSVCSALALWQLMTPEPTFSPFSMGLVLVMLGGIAGLRWGAESASHLFKEMAQLNRYLAEQNQELTELDHLLLKQMLAQEEEFSEPEETEAETEEHQWRERTPKHG